MNITQWTREREQKIAAANREARKAYVDRLYNSGWRDNGPQSARNRPRSYETAPVGGLFDFLLMACLVGAMALSWWLIP